MKKYKLFGLLIIVLVSSCSKDDDTISEPALDCLIEFESLASLGECDEYENPFPDDSCETISLGESKLEDTSKEYIAQACQDINQNINYVNDEGETISMVVSRKTYKDTRRSYRSIQVCENDSTKVISYCLKSEFIVIRLNSENPEIQLEIKLEKFIDMESPEPGEFGDMLSVLRKKNMNSSYRDFKYLLNKGTLDFENFIGEENYESLEILGTVFNNVMSFDSSIYQDPRFKIFYNQTIGLVAFRDTNNIIWRIE